MILHGNPCIVFARIKYGCETFMVHVDIALEWQHTERIAYREVTSIWKGRALATGPLVFDARNFQNWAFKCYTVYKLSWVSWCILLYRLSYEHSLTIVLRMLLA